MKTVVKYARVSLLGFMLGSLFVRILLFPTSAKADSTIETGSSTSQTTIQTNVNTNILHVGCNCTPTPPTSISPTLTGIPLVLSPTASSQVSPVPTSVSSSNSGSSSGTRPGGSLGSGAGSPGSVLGTSAQQQAAPGVMASTGTFGQDLMNLSLILGCGLIAISSFKIKRTLSTF